MYFILTYIAGLFLCVIANSLDKKFGHDEFGIPFFVIVWTFSPIAVPISIFVGFLFTVGKVMRVLSDILIKHY